jgi:tetratricopeptide (TPR) repeat protein
MKKYSIIIAMLFVFVTGFSAYGAPLAPGVENPDNTQSDWLWYSKGLFYKSMRDYNRAIECFKKSESSGRELARVYFQIAGCFYHIRNFEMTNSYAGLSIKQDRKYVKPYLLMYNSYMRLGNHRKAADTLEDLLS